MRILKTTTAVAALLLFGAAGCADLDVANLQDPGRDQVLVTPGDIESLIAGSYNTWYNGTYHYDNTFWASNASFQSISTAANFGNIDHSGIPRTPIMNQTSYGDYGDVVERVWSRSYRALAAVADGLRTMNDDPSIGEAIDEERIRAFGKMVQGIGHATLAVWYDQGFVVDETTNTAEPQTRVSYEEMLNAAMGYFDEAISLASANTFEIPAQWMSQDVPSDELVQIIYSLKAVFRASVPRTADEAVNWQAVLSDLGNGTSYTMDADWTSIWYNGAFDVGGGPNGWGADNYFVIGMADQSGDYQQWLSAPVADRTAWFGAGQDDDPFLIQTPDTRFPTGTTIAEQEANPGEYYVIPREDTWDYDVSEHFTRPARGTWRWSYYYYPTSWNYWFGIDFDVPMLSEGELTLLEAEALLATGEEAAAAELINVSREAHGLSTVDPTLADDGNTSCVPKLPDGSCGDIWEMLKWEKRLETRNIGLFGLSWFWDGRRWGDLYKGTPLQLPIPAGEAETLQFESYTFGGCGEGPPSAAPLSTYAYPFEADC